MALDELNTQLVYETSFTVSVGGYEQDMSSISAVNAILSAAYPWTEGDDLTGQCFGCRLAEWRLTGPNTLYFCRAQPAAGEIIRVRYTKLHAIQELDGAAATTVPDLHRSLVGLWAAAFACELRIRQISENPALPKEAVNTLRLAAARYRSRAVEMISHVPPLGKLRWAAIGLD
jgi:hypothetical protein